MAPEARNGEGEGIALPLLSNFCFLRLLLTNLDPKKAFTMSGVDATHPIPATSGLRTS